ncbi:MAG: TerC family protein [Pseudomonadota bacterium]
MSDKHLLTIIFIVLLLVTFVVDLLALNTREKEVSVKKSLLSAGLWALSAIIFGGFLFIFIGKELGLQYITGYLVEESLSLDNLFVFILIFSYFKVPERYQHRALAWGIVGAIVLRGVFIFAGIELIRHFHWSLYILGAFLIYTAIKLFFKSDEEVDLENNIVLKFVKRHLPLTNQYHKDHFFIRRVEDGKKMATPMLVVLLIIATTDLVFAIDSIPTILGISQDTLVVYTSNIYAVMGLRSLFFALSTLIKYFHYLHHGLAIILFFIGAKMIAEYWFKIPVELALGFVFLVLILSALLSLIRQRRLGPQNFPH